MRRLLMAFALVACGDSGNDPPVIDPTIVGMYDLTHWDTDPLPADVGPDRILSGTLQLREDDTYTLTWIEDGIPPEPFTLTGPWAWAGQTVEFESVEFGAFEGIISELSDIRTITVELIGFSLTFRAR